MLAYIATADKICTMSSSGYDLHVFVEFSKGMCIGTKQKIHRLNYFVGCKNTDLKTVDVLNLLYFKTKE